MSLADVPVPFANPRGLNIQAGRLLESARGRVADLGIGIEAEPFGEIWDLGVQQPGGLEAGILLGEVCLGGLGKVQIQPSLDDTIPFPVVSVYSDQPLRACLLSQFAGWQIQVGSYFAMGSGPMRAAYANEAIFKEVAPGIRDKTTEVIGVLETGTLPGSEVFEWIQAKIGGETNVVLLAASSKSLAGGVQVVARSLETALHKLHELHFPLDAILSGAGAAPLPPPAKGTLDSIGRTNDAILYAGRVVLYVRTSDDLIADLGPKVPSSASSMHGKPFGEILKEAGGDFYKVDPLLFAPAEVVICNLASGRTFRFGKKSPETFLKSCGS